MGLAQVVDARSAERLRGEAAEPRAGVRPGHMPHSVNLPFTTLIENGRLKQPDDIRRVLTQAGIDLARPIITSCGSGVTAAVLTLALAQIGEPAPQLYDGSWSEWGADPNRPVATGPVIGAARP